MVSPESNLFVAPQPDVVYQPVADYQLFREQVLGDEGGIKSTLAVGVTLAGVILAGLSYVNKWGPFKVHVDAGIVAESQIDEILFPVDPTILEIKGSTRVDVPVNFSFGPIGGSVVGCSNRYFDDEVIFSSVLDTSASTVATDDSKRSYKLDIAQSPNGTHHLVGYFDPTKFSVKNADPHQKDDPSCVTHTDGFISVARIFETQDATQFQTDLNQTADNLSKAICPSTVVSMYPAAISLALGKWMRNEVGGLKLVLDKAVKEAYPDNPDNVLQNFDQILNELATNVPEVHFVESPNNASAVLSNDLGVEALPFAQAPPYTKKQLIEMVGLNPNELAEDDVTISYPKKCNVSEIVSSQIPDVLKAVGDQAVIDNAAAGKS